MSEGRERLTVFMHNEAEHEFLSPPFDRSGYFQWWSISDGILMVTVQQSPRRVRCFPLTAVQEWTHEYDVRDAGEVAA